MCLSQVLMFNEFDLPQARGATTQGDAATLVN